MSIRKELVTLAMSGLNERFPPWLTQYCFDQWDFSFCLNVTAWLSYDCCGSDCKDRAAWCCISWQSLQIACHHNTSARSTTSWILQGRSANFKRKWRREQKFCWGNAVCLKLGEKLPEEFFLFFLKSSSAQAMPEEDNQRKWFHKGPNVHS